MTEQSPQLIFWADLIRTNLQGYKGIEVSPASVSRAIENGLKVMKTINECGGFDAYWEKYHQSDWMATAYVTTYTTLSSEERQTLARNAVLASLLTLTTFITDHPDVCVSGDEGHSF